MLVLVLILLFVGAAALLAALWAMALMLLRPHRMTDGKAMAALGRLSPGDLGMRFEELTFNVRDQRTGGTLSIAAWWIPHPGPLAAGGKCVVLIHGYADAKVGAIAWAPTWQSLGYNILAIDLRAHGYSGGKHTTAGFYERHDLDQVINQLRADHPSETRHLVLFGVSMGAAVALGTAELRDDVAALVLECPYATFPASVRYYAHEFGMPLPRLSPIAIRIAEWISGADFDQVRAVEQLARVRAPVMIIQSDRDHYVPPEDARQIRATGARAGAAVWCVPECEHVLSVAADPAEYRRRIAEFLGQIEAPVSDARRASRRAGTPLNEC